MKLVFNLSFLGIGLLSLVFSSSAHARGRGVVLAEKQPAGIKKYLFTRDNDAIVRGFCKSNAYSVENCSENAERVPAGKLYLYAYEELEAWLGRMIGGASWSNFTRLNELDEEVKTCFAAAGGEKILALLQTNQTRFSQMKELKEKFTPVIALARTGQDPEAVKSSLNITSRFLALRGDFTIDSGIIDELIGKQTSGAAPSANCQQLISERLNLTASIYPGASFPAMGEEYRPAMAHEWALRTQSAIRSVNWMIEQFEKETGFIFVAEQQGISESWHSGVPLWFLRGQAAIHLEEHSYKGTLAPGQNKIEVTVPEVLSSKKVGVLRCTFETNLPDYQERSSCFVKVTSPNNKSYEEWRMPLFSWINCSEQPSSDPGNNALCGEAVAGVWKIEIPRCTRSVTDPTPVTLTSGKCSIAAE